MDRNDNNEIKAARFVCAAKLYSRVLNEPIWVVLRYPYMDQVEYRYPATKASLGLSRKPKWKIWPDPFRPTDDCNVYRLPETERTR
jgi:hypothetical protein